MNYLFAFSYSSFTFSNKKLLTNFAMQLLIFLIICQQTNSSGSSMEEVIIWLLRNQVFLIFAPHLLSTERFSGFFFRPVPLQALVGSNGLGPSTSRLSGVCSNQLSYEPMFGGGNRVRTDDPLLAGQVLYQLSYTPIIPSEFPPRRK